MFDADTAHPAVGDVVDDRFRLVGVVSRGSNALVFEGVELGRRRRVAVKFLCAPRDDAKGRQRFARGIAVLRQLEHPGIASLYAADATASPPWMATELVDGVDLETLLDLAGRLEPHRAVDIAIHTLEALAAVHDQNIVHRDIKPSNLMVVTPTAHGGTCVKIIDFGIAKSLQVDAAAGRIITRYNEVPGTPRFVAPETLFDDRHGPHSDVYCVGLVLFQMLVGDVAVKGESRSEIVRNQLSAPIVQPGWLADTALGRVLERACRKSWTHRYPDARTFADALREVTADAATDDMDGNGTPGRTRRTTSNGMPGPAHASLAIGPAAHRPPEAVTSTLDLVPVKRLKASPQSDT